ncbi:17154_t:CDS:2, partial [Gigaspora rosea]
TLNQLILDEKSIMNEDFIESTNNIALTSDEQDNIFSAFSSGDTSVISAQSINCDGRGTSGCVYMAKCNSTKMKNVVFALRCIEVTSNNNEAKIEGFVDE